MPENCYISDVSIIPDVTPYDSTIELLEALREDTLRLIELKNQYLMKKVWNKMIQTYDWASFDKVIRKYVEDNETC